MKDRAAVLYGEGQEFEVDEPWQSDESVTARRSLTLPSPRPGGGKGPRRFRLVPGRAEKARGLRGAARSLMQAPHRGPYPFTA